MAFDTELANFLPRQLVAIERLDSGLIKFLLYGGALGGGKSYFLRWYAARRLMILYHVFGIEDAVGMLACEDYPSLKDRQLQKIEREFPAWLGKMHGDHKVFGRCFILKKKWGGGVICFRNLDDPSKYQSAEFAFVLVDELTKNDYDVFTFLRSRLRWPGLPDIEAQFIGATNPGGVGHGWVKQIWMDKIFGEEWHPPYSPIDYREQFAYVPSKATDNPHLDVGYWAVLNTLPENLRAAFRDGDWNVFIGQAFQEFRTVVDAPGSHVVSPRPVPSWAQVYMTFDWGYGAPFSIGWWYVDQDGRIYRFGEWYGWANVPNQGLRLSDSDIAKGIIDREEQLNLTKDRPIIRLSGPDCFSKKPDYKGGGQGPSTAEVFSGYNLYLTPGDPSRSLKLRQFHERLRDPKNGQAPMMQIFSTCTQFIRTIPNLIMDEHNIEDIDTTGEDHVYDEACHIMMARPLKLAVPEATTASQRMIDYVEGRTKEFPWERDEGRGSGNTYITFDDDD